MSLTENHIGDVAIVHFVDLNWDTPAIVPDLDLASLGVYIHLDHVLRLVIRVIVSSVNQNLI